MKTGMYNITLASKDNPYGLTAQGRDLYALMLKYHTTLPSDTFSEIHSIIKRAKKALRSDNTDMLAYKQNHYGNKGQWGRMKEKELLRNLWHGKTPPKDANIGKYLTVEIECKIPVGRNTDAMLVLQRKIKKAGLGPIVTLKGDSSINCEDNETGVELVLTVVQGQYEPIVQLCNILSSVGAEVDDSCGLHVHFDFRHVASSRAMTASAQKIARAVPALKLMLPHSRRNNRYCMQNINSRSGGSERYAFVNVQAYDKYKTLEIRGHSGTTDATKIINWIGILLTIMGTKKRYMEDALTIDALLERYPFNPSLREYILARAARFNKKRNEGEDSSEENGSIIRSAFENRSITINSAFQRQYQGQLVSNTSDMIDNAIAGAGRPPSQEQERRFAALNAYGSIVDPASVNNDSDNG